VNSGYKICRATNEADADSDLQSDFLIIGIDLTEEDAIDLNVPIRPGKNGEKYVWFDDINPQ
jgi:hypothetical protein